MIKIRQDLCLDNPNTLDELYNIKFEFTSGRFSARNLQNLISFDTESANGFLKNDGSNQVVGFNQDKYDRGILKTHGRTKEQIDANDEDVRYMYFIDNETTPVGIIYMWQIAIEDGHGGIYTYIGRTWDEYNDFMIRLTNEVKRQSLFGFKCHNRDYEYRRLEKIKTNVNMWIHTHNLGHDFSMMRSLYNDKFDNAKHTRVFARKNRKPLKATMRLNNVNIIYKDTLTLWQKSLKNVAEDCPNCPIEKLDDFDYLTIKTPKDKLEPLEIKYGIHDCCIIIFALEYEREIYGTVENIPLTATSKIRRILVDKVSMRNPYWAYTCAYITKHYSPEEYRKRIALYAGGYTHGCSLHVGKVGKVYAFDLASSYPSSVCTAYFPTEGYEPCDVSEFEELSKQDVERPKYRWFARFRFTNVRSKLSWSYWSSSKCLDKDNVLEDNGRVRRASMLDFYATDLDYDTFCQAYSWDTMEVLEIEKGRASLLPREFINTILDLYENKTSLKGTDRESEYIESKVAINGCYGNMCLKIIADKIYFDENGWQVRRLDDEGDPMYYELLSDISETKSNVFFDLGIIVSAVSRHRLWQFISHFDSKCWYVDTDSIKVDATEEDLKWIEDWNKWIEKMEDDVAKELQIDPNRFCPLSAKGERKRLGIMEPEYKGKPVNLKYLGAKRYVIEQDGEIECTIAGLPKSAGAKKIKKLSDFDNNTLWTTKESEKVCCYYNDNQPERMEWTGRDGEIYYSDDKYGVCLKPVTFDLSMSEEFVAFLNLLLTGRMDNEDIRDDKVPKYLLK